MSWNGSKLFFDSLPDHITFPKAKCRINVQNKETCVHIVAGSASNDEVAKHVQKLHPRVRIRLVGNSRMYLRMKMTKVQIQALKDYLEFVFN